VVVVDVAGGATGDNLYDTMEIAKLAAVNRCASGNDYGDDVSLKRRPHD
jgi:hypothetical protein